MKERNRILIIDLARLGDLTLSSPVISNLRLNHPIAHIAFLVSRDSLSTVQHNPKLNEVFIYDKPPNGFLSRFTHILKISKLLRKEKFHSAFILHRSFTSALIALIAGIPERIGLSTQGRWFLLTKRIPLDKNLHRLDNNLRILESANEEIRFRNPEYYPGDKTSETTSLLEKFKGTAKLVVVNPNGVWETKRWNIDKFADLAQKLSQSENTKIVIIGGKGDEERGSIVRGKNENILNLTGKTSVDDLYRIFKMSDLVITNDSGPMHVAAAADSRIIAIFGPTDPQRCGPRSANPKILFADVECLKCYKKTCDNRKCMNSLSVELVFDEAKKILKS